MRKRILGFNEAVASNKYKNYYNKKISKFDLGSIYSFLTAICDEAPDCFIELVYNIGEEFQKGLQQKYRYDSLRNALRSNTIIKNKIRIQPTDRLTIIKDIRQSFNNIEFAVFEHSIAFNRIKTYLTAGKFTTIFDHLIRHDADFFIQIKIKINYSIYDHILDIIEHHKNYLDVEFTTMTSKDRLTKDITILI